MSGKARGLMREAELKKRMPSQYVSASCSIQARQTVIQGVPGLLSFGLGLSHDFIRDLMAISDI